ncbi:hypothetical protein PAAG_12549 [Paracoccidioides lutzii Pb01]|uniref:Uncharacterized protein n=1 Tax=Paracoccidioides lutzii (strain ATCC MYA-826 / Pb01) TaxID=502779 RepID=A0A0A2VIP5_PARBA|nr:hypothetical protein PAAG_12549 [Paracoccidioides lutzii Pb01]KGQ00789.1 hypothetical protein PAAG_12549 [Paracoccidioides lutzii Pb01]
MVDSMWDSLSNFPIDAKMTVTVKRRNRFIHKPDFKGTVAPRSLPPDDKFNDCGYGVTQACLREIYNIGNFMATPDPRNKLGISGYLED